MFVMFTYPRISLDIRKFVDYYPYPIRADMRIASRIHIRKFANRITQYPRILRIVPQPRPCDLQYVEVRRSSHARLTSSYAISDISHHSSQFHGTALYGNQYAEFSVQGFPYRNWPINSFSSTCRNIIIPIPLDYIPYICVYDQFPLIRHTLRGYKPSFDSRVILSQYTWYMLRRLAGRRSWRRRCAGEIRYVEWHMQRIFPDGVILPVTCPDLLLRLSDHRSIGSRWPIVVSCLRGS